MGPEVFEFLLDYVTRSNVPRMPAKAYSSAFEAGAPGVMRLDEVEQEVNLGRWKLKVRNISVLLQVR